MKNDAAHGQKCTCAAAEVLSGIVMYANNEPKSALARDSGTVAIQGETREACFHLPDRLKTLCIWRMIEKRSEQH